MLNHFKFTSNLKCQLCLESWFLVPTVALNLFFMELKSCEVRFKSHKIPQFFCHVHCESCQFNRKRFHSFTVNFCVTKWDERSLCWLRETKAEMKEAFVFLVHSLFLLGQSQSSVTAIRLQQPTGYDANIWTLQYISWNSPFITFHCGIMFSTHGTVEDEYLLFSMVAAHIGQCGDWLSFCNSN